MATEMFPGGFGKATDSMYEANVLQFPDAFSENLLSQTGIECSPLHSNCNPTDCLFALSSFPAINPNSGKGGRSLGSTSPAGYKCLAGTINPTQFSTNRTPSQFVSSSDGNMLCPQDETSGYTLNSSDTMLSSQTKSDGTTPPDITSTNLSLEVPQLDMAALDGKDESPPTATPIQSYATRRAARTRVPHNIIERRYRHNLNSQIDALSAKIPAMRERWARTLDIEDGAYSLRGPSKADVLASAIGYIDQLEKKSRDNDELVKLLQSQVSGLQKLVQCDDCAILRQFQDLNVAPTSADMTLLSQSE